jgi:hypothetical protein
MQILNLVQLRVLVGRNPLVVPKTVVSRSQSPCAKRLASARAQFAKLANVKLARFHNPESIIQNPEARI